MGRTITFFGASGNVGTSMIATSCAHDLARLKKKVLLIYASSHLGEDFIEDNIGIGIDDLRRKNQMTLEEVNAIIVNDVCRFHYIKSVREITQIKYFNIGIISSIEAAVGKNYDFILVDGGSDIQYPLTAASLIAAEKRFFITTGTMKALRRLQNIKELLLVPKGMYQGSHIIENKYDRSEGSIALPSQIQQRFGLPCIEVPYVKGGERAEADRKLLFGNSGFDKGIRCITGEIVRGYGVKNGRERVFNR